MGRLVVRFSLLLFFLIGLAGCNDDEDFTRPNREKVEYKIPDLKQTLWTGVREYEFFDKVERVDEVHIIFLSENRGNSCVYGGDDYGNQQRDFEYSVNDRLLSIKGKTENYENHFLNGDWILTERKGNQMVLVNGLNQPRERYVLRLTQEDYTEDY